jgi:hypothetical protein
LLQEKQLLLDSVDRHAYCAAQNMTEGTRLLRQQFSSLQAQRRLQEAAAAPTQSESISKQRYTDASMIAPVSEAETHRGSGKQGAGKNFCFIATQFS